MGQLRNIGLLAVSLAFTALGATLAMTGEGQSRATGLACAAFFGGCGIVFAARLLPSVSPHTDAQGVTLILPDRTQLAGLTAAATLLAVACPQIAALAGASGDPITLAMGLFGAVFFGIGALVSLLRLMRPVALYRLDPVGIANLQGAGWFIPWRAIRGIDPFAVRGEYFLALDVDPAIGAPVGFAGKLNQFAGLPGIAIGTQGTAVRFDVFAALVQRYWDRGRLMHAHN